MANTNEGKAWSILFNNLAFFVPVIHIGIREPFSRVFPTPIGAFLVSYFGVSFEFRSAGDLLLLFFVGVRVVIQKSKKPGLEDKNRKQRKLSVGKRQPLKMLVSIL